MTAQTTETTAGQAAWQPKLVYGMAGICLLGSFRWLSAARISRSRNLGPNSRTFFPSARFFQRPDANPRPDEADGR